MYSIIYRASFYRGGCLGDYGSSVKIWFVQLVRNWRHATTSFPFWLALMFVEVPSDPIVVININTRHCLSKTSSIHSFIMSQRLPHIGFHSRLNNSSVSGDSVSSWCTLQQEPAFIIFVIPVDWSASVFLIDNIPQFGVGPTRCIVAIRSVKHVVFWNSLFTYC